MFNTNHIHPMFVHFPIALITIGFFFDILNPFVKKKTFIKCGYYLMILGTLSSFAAYLTGDSLIYNYAVH